jgi:hypothetical protein
MTGLGQSVFLQAAVGFTGDGHLYQIGRQCWTQMQCQKIRPMGQTQGLHQLLQAQCLTSQRNKQTRDLFGDLRLVR